jgi:hypothetical protein
MAFFSKKSPAEDIEAELAAFTKRRASLESKLCASITSVETARESRRNHLIDGADDDAAALTKIEKRLADAERDEAALRDAINTLAAREGDARARLAVARDADARERRATEIEAAARAIEIAGARLEKAVEAVAAEFAQITDLIPSEAIQTRRYVPLIGHDDRPLSSRELIAAALFEGLYQQIPEAFQIVGGSSVAEIKAVISYRMSDGSLCDQIPIDDESVSLLPASGAVEQTIVAPLRKAADHLRNPPEPPAPIIEPTPFANAEIVFAKKAMWTDEWGEQKFADAWLATVPTPVAEAALAAGIAFRSGTEEAREEVRKQSFISTMDPRWRAQIPLPEIVDLRVNIKELRDAERERLNAPRARAAE